MDASSLPDSLRRTLALFEDSGEPWTTSEVAARLAVGRRSTYGRLDSLVERGSLDTKKVGASARVWYRPGGRTDGTQHEQTDESASEYRLDQWETQFRSLVEATEEYAIFLLDPDGSVRTWNPGAERIKGYAADDIIGEHFSTFYTGAARERGVPEANLAAAAAEGSAEDEGWRVRADGSLFWANVTITAIRDDDGTLEGYTKVTRDMTERHAYEQRLKEEQAFIESILDTQRDLIYAFDVDGTFLRWNDRFSEVTGYTDDEIAEMRPEAFIADRAVGETVDAIERVIEHGETVSIELPLETSAGEEIPYEFTGGPLTDDEGTIIGFTGIGRDVSDRKARERRLERQRDDLAAELNDVFARIDDAFFAIDEEWRFTHVNDQAAAALDRSAESLTGRTIWEAFPEAVDSTFQEQYERAMTTQESVAFEEYYPPLESWFEVSVYPSEDGLSVYFRDVTERKQRERELEEANRRFRTLIEHFPNGGVALVDQHLRYVTFGGTPVGDTDVSRADLEGTRLRKSLPREIADVVIPGYEAAFEGHASEFEETIGDSVYQFHFLPVRDDDGDVFAALGMSQDITKRKESERALEQRLRQQEVVTDLGRRALEDSDLDTLMAEATERVADTLGTDYCKVLDLDADAAELFLRQGVGWDEGLVGSATVSAVEDQSQAAYTLATEQPVVVDDLRSDSRFSGPDLLTSHDVRSGISVIIGSPDEPWGILGIHDTSPREFTEQDASFVQSVANILASAIERTRYEQQLLDQREQIAALNNINEVVRGITSAVIEQSTRAEIEQTVCERLVETDSYEFAWIGEADTATQTVRTRTEAGVAGYLDDNTISVDPDDEQSQGPTGRAFLTGEVQTTHDAEAEPQYGPWSDAPGEHGFRSSAAIPIVHEETIYGVLNVYADRPHAFEGQERDVIAQLGEVVAHAIAATERKQALLSDEVVELEFQIENVFESFGIENSADGPIRFEHTVLVEDDDFLFFGETPAENVGSLEAMVEAIPYYEDISFREGNDGVRFELLASDPPAVSVIAALGGSVEEAVIEDGDLRLRVHLSPSADVRQLTDAMTDAYPDTTLLRRRQLTIPARGDEPTVNDMLSDLTDRQLATLEAAYHAGFFEWPRDASGQDVADSLGVSPPTFHQHLRKAERKVFDVILSKPVTGAV
jgi:PAS domain S-box-containing protein